MCLTTKDPTIKTAQKDLLVFKKCEVRADGTAIAPVLYFEYKSGFVPEEVSLEPSFVSKQEYTVHSGYHSYNKVKEGVNCLFIIPKGSQYIDGWYNDEKKVKNRVSSKIMFKRKLNWVERVFYRLVSPN